MSKTRASKVRSQIQEELGTEVSYQQIAEMCRQLKIDFKSHEQMGIHYNSVLDESESSRIIQAFRDRKKTQSAPQRAEKTTDRPSTQAQAPQRTDSQRHQAQQTSHPRRDSSPERREGSHYQRNNDYQPRERRYDQSGERSSQSGSGERPARSGGYEQRSSRPGGYEQRSPRPGGSDQRSPRPGGYEQRSPRPGGSDQRSPRPGGYDQRSPRPGGSDQRSPRPGGYEQRSPRPGGPDQRSPRPASRDGAPPRRNDQRSDQRPPFRKPEEQSRPAPFPVGRGDSGRSHGRGSQSAGSGRGSQSGAGRDRGGYQTPHSGAFGPPATRKKGKKSKYKKERLQNQQQEKQVELAPEDKIVELHQHITVGELADKMQIRSGEVIKALFMKGMMTNINQALELETAEMVAQELGYEVILPSATQKEEGPQVAPQPLPVDEDPDTLKSRPPVVTIMGHVDHGKTSLLDRIRESRVTEGEAGGITQHIGAYMVKLNDRPIAFLDTPGHEAFTAMRARGAQVTDIAILVIAADDGIMPQTVEAINHAKAAKVQIIVAVNKIDKPGADLDRAKQQLTEHELVPEEWGGQTVVVPVSAKTGEGVDDLLEMILLVADLLELKANPDKAAQGVVIEAKLDKGRGSVGTVLIQSGTLRQGDAFVVGPVWGKVRAMTNERGEKLKKAGPSVPVEIIGFQDVPTAGDILQVVATDKEAKAIATKKLEQQQDDARSRSRVNLSNLYENMQEGKLKELNVVVKADVQGSVDAIKQSLERLSNEQVQIRILHGATGEISEYDIMLASASDALVVGFNVKADNNAKNVAQQEQVEIRFYSIIYKLIEDIQNAMEGLLEPEMIEVSIGAAEVRAVFKISKMGTIAGSYMTEGRCERNARVRVVRNGEVLHTGRLSSLKRFKDDVKEVGTGYECGIGVKDFNDLVEGDRLEFFLIQARHEVAKA